MADTSAHQDVSPPSSHSASILTADQSNADAGIDQDAPNAHSSSQARPTQPQAQSMEALVSHTAAGDPTVTVETADPGAAAEGLRKRVTVERYVSQSQQLPTAQQQHNGRTGGDLASRQPEKKTPQQPKYTFLGMLRCWLLELFALLLAAIVVVILVILLSYYHDRDISSWNHDWAINSVFAFLTAIMEASVAFAIGSCLGQLRWLWYTNTHDKMELKWMDRLTNAKSPPGAFRFAIGNAKTAYRHTAFWGAALVMSLLGVGVFTQQVITIRGQERSVDDNGGVSRATVPINSFYEGQWQYGATGAEPGDQMPWVPTIAAIQAGFLLPTSFQSIDRSLAELVTCPSGNCTFGKYSTLSLCWQCADITNEVLCGDAYLHPESCPEGERTRVRDNSVSLDPGTGVVNITSDDQYPKYANFTGVGPLVARYVGLGYWTKPAYATECAMYWCVADYKSSSESYTFSEKSTKYWTNLTAPHTYYGSDWYIHLRPETCYVNGKPRDECNFGVDALSQRALQNFLLNGSVSTNTTGFLKGTAEVPDSDNNGTNWIIQGLAANAIVTPCTNYGQCNETFYKEFDLSFEWMAYYLSNNIREISGGYTHGTETRFDTYFHVRWGWLAYPIAIVLIALIFLLVTMYKSRHSMPWKSSVTALLLHGLTDEDREESINLDDPRQMKHAEDWVVTLQDHQGTRTFKVKTRGNGKAHLDVGTGTEGMANVGIAMLEALEEADIR